MPFIQVSANVPIPPAVSEALHKGITKEINETYGKPVEYIMVRIEGRASLTMGGSTEPCAVVQVSSIGKIDLTYNSKVTMILCDMLNDHLKVAGSRVYVFFNDCERPNVGWDFKTFAE
eukprot:Nk52_evm20s2531 gene=Nk52_evmTU20s2531